MKKILWISALGLTFSLTTLDARTPIEAARETPQITEQIFSDYLSGYDTHSIVAHLRNTQELLKRSIHDEELSNLLQYLDLCINDLRRAIIQPATDANTRHINDLLHAITEGSHFIADTLSSKKVVVASR